ncbi:MAG: PAS domain S-box protein, partial [Deltaproteobacteria bacterium]|nr:PAS domain S-box protein [Deltaproteobacteria bacterium]
LQRLTLFQRMLAFVIVVSIVLILTEISNIPQLGQLKDITKNFYEHPYTTINAVKDVKYAVLDGRRVQREIIMENSLEKRQVLNELEKQYDTKVFTGLNIIKKTFLGDQDLVKESEALYRKLIEYRATNFVLMGQGHIEESWARTLDSAPGNPAAKLAENLDLISDFAENGARAVYQQAQDTYRAAIWESIWYTLGGLLVLALVSVVFTRSITLPLGRFLHRIVGLSEGGLDEDIPFLHLNTEFGQIGRALEALRRVARTQESQTQGKAEVAEMTQTLQVCTTFEEFGNVLTSRLAPVMGLVYGALYVFDSISDCLVRAGGYACDDAVPITRFALGQGLIGQAALDRRQIELLLPVGESAGTTVGLGRVRIKAVLIVPVVRREKVLGVIEFGTRNPFGEEQKAFLNTLLPVVAMNMEILGGNIETRQLLEKSREQAQALVISERQLLSRQDELEKINAQLGVQARALEEQAEELMTQKESLSTQRQELAFSQEILSQTEERSRLILSSVNEGIWGMDAAGGTAFVNPAGAAMLGYTPAELLGQSMHALVHYARLDGSDYPQPECPMYRTSQDGVPRTVSDEILWRKDGSFFMTEYTSTPIIKNGELTGAVIVFRDITERKKAEALMVEREVAVEAAQQSERARETAERAQAELREKMAEIARFNALAMGREQRIIELKNEVNTLSATAGLVLPYKSLESEET